MFSHVLKKYTCSGKYKPRAVFLSLHVFIQSVVWDELALIHYTYILIFILSDKDS